MSKKTTWTCDRCGKVAEKIDDTRPPKGFFELLLMMDELVNIRRSSSPRLAALWCLGCCEAMNIGPWRVRAPDKPAPTPPNLEDLIREIAREEAGNVVGNP